MPPRACRRFGLIAGALVLALGLACAKTPCVTCQALLFKGAPVDGYLATHPKPQATHEETDGGHTYEWVFTETETLPTSPAQQRQDLPPTPSFREGWSGLTDALLWFSLDALGSRDRPQNPKPFVAHTTFYLVSIRANARGLVQSYTCNRVSLSNESARFE